jgi:sensor histidine kinase YesM
MNKILKNQSEKSKRRLYWTCQLLGWGLVSIYWAYVVYSRDNYSVFYTLLNYVADILIGVFLTHIYRYFALIGNWKLLTIKQLLKRVIPSILVLAILYVIICNIKWYFFRIYVVEENTSFIDAILYWDPILLTGLRLMSIWILAYHLYHYYQKEVVTAKENSKLSILIKQTQLDNLSAQLNPHFLFNSLNSIKSLVIENPNVARRAIDLLSDLLRSSLYDKDKDLITIEEELALINDYVELEKLRFEERLQLEIVLDNSLLKFKIPTLSIQLLIENAIKHGIDLKVGGGKILLIIKQIENAISISVVNPGIINKHKKSGLGLKNLRQRLEIQYKGKASFSLTETAKDQVIAEIIIPNNTNTKNV